MSTRALIGTLALCLAVACGPSGKDDVVEPDETGDETGDGTGTGESPDGDENASDGTGTGDGAAAGDVSDAGGESAAETPPAGDMGPSAPPLPAFDDAAQEMAWRGNGFATDMHRRLAANESGNLTFSPLSIHQALLMTEAGARGETADEMRSVLHVPEGSHGAAGDLAARLGQGENTAVMANRIWAQKGYPVESPFKTLLEKQFGAGMGILDFTKNPEKARKTINKWVGKKTKKKIPELLEKGQITKQTRLVLTNAVYLDARWEDEFEKNATHDRCFANGDGSGSEVPMMYEMLVHPIHEAGDGTLVVEKPYKGDDMSMWLVLPPPGADPGAALEELEQDLTPELLYHWMQEADGNHGTKVGLTLPKFEDRFRKELGDDLKKLGMPSAFDGETADFSGMTSAEEPFSIGLVVHEAFVEVDEKGTVAAAATAVTMEGGGMPKYVPFQANRPFLWFITENTTGAILFMGRVMRLEGASCTPPTASGSTGGKKDGLSGIDL